MLFGGHVSNLMNLKCNAPTFLVEIVGPSIAISGGIIAGRITIAPLTPMFHLLYNPYEKQSMLETVKIMKAFRIGVERLYSYYYYNEYVNDCQPEYPYIKHYKLNNKTISFEYIQRLEKKLVFLVKEKLSGINKIVKFTKSHYCNDLHDLLYKHGFAPKRYTTEELPGDWRMVVMEYLDTNQYCNLHTLLFDLKTKKDEIVKRLKEILNVIHQNGFVHGDFRPNNLIIIRLSTN